MLHSISPVFGSTRERLFQRSLGMKNLRSVIKRGRLASEVKVSFFEVSQRPNRFCLHEIPVNQALRQKQGLSLGSMLEQLPDPTTGGELVSTTLVYGSDSKCPNAKFLSPVLGS